MDDPVSRRRAAPLFALAFAAAYGAAGLARAEGLPDPTRPPASLMAGATAGSAAVVASSAAPQLQSVLIAAHEGGRRVAVIDGQTLRVGDKFKGARLASMTDTEVVLVQGKQRQILKLFPATATH